MDGNNDFNGYNGYNGYNEDNYGEGYGSSNNYRNDEIVLPYYYFAFFILLYLGCLFGRYYYVNNNGDELSISINNSSTINKIKKNTLDYNLLKKDSDCSICLEPFSKDKEIIILECKHIYHTDCIVQWLNKDISCPLCRESSLI